MIKLIENFFKKNGMEPNEARAEAEFLVCGISGFSVEKILMGEKIQNEDKIWTLARKRIETGAPIQHIVGFSYFMNDKFIVNPDVLIPRPETEILVRQTIKLAKKISGNLKILDIGCGTGCIALEISKNLPEFDCVDKTLTKTDIESVEKKRTLEILGVDISTSALQVAIKNMEALKQQRRVIFRKSDIFSSIYDDEKFDIILSNPPYIPISAKNTLQNEVKNFDPALALFTSDEEGIEFYKRILEGAKKYLKPNGYVLFELGYTNNIKQSDIVSKIAQKHGFTLDFIKKDLSKIDRVIGFYL